MDQQISARRRHLIRDKRVVHDGLNDPVETVASPVHLAGVLWIRTPLRPSRGRRANDRYDAANNGNRRDGEDHCTSFS
jgi:hypothetical protein